MCWNLPAASLPLRLHFIFDFVFSCLLLPEARIAFAKDHRYEISFPGGCCLLLDQRVDVGSFLDLQVEEAAGWLPLLQVLELRSKGRVWLVRCTWLQKLSKDKLQCLLGKPQKKCRKGDIADEKPAETEFAHASLAAFPGRLTARRAWLLGGGYNNGCKATAERLVVCVAQLHHGLEPVAAGPRCGGGA
jgi:hypothetical protein